MQKNHAYFHVSSRGCGIVGVVGKISKTNIWGHWNSRGLEKTKSFNSWGGGGGGGVGGWLLNCFFLSFSNHGNYGIENICVCSKSKIKTKVTTNIIYNMIN